MTVPKRQKQPVTGRFGTLVVSPLKKHDKRKTSTLVTRLGHGVKLQSLQNKMRSILAGKHKTNPAPIAGEWEDDITIDEDALCMPNDLESQPMPVVVLPADKTVNRRVLPTASDHTLFNRWKELLPTLVDPLIAYKASTNGRKLTPKEEVKSLCNDEACSRHTKEVFCLFLDRKSYFSSCPFQSISRPV